MLLIFMVGSSLAFYFKMVFEYQLDLEVYNQEMWKKSHPEDSDDDEEKQRFKENQILNSH